MNILKDAQRQPLGKASLKWDRRGKGNVRNIMSYCVTAVAVLLMKSTDRFLWSCRPNLLSTASFHQRSSLSFTDNQICVSKQPRSSDINSITPKVKQTAEKLQKWKLTDIWCRLLYCKLHHAKNVLASRRVTAEAPWNEHSSRFILVTCLVVALPINCYYLPGKH